jgi:hypothetical protein
MKPNHNQGSSGGRQGLPPGLPGNQGAISTFGRAQSNPVKVSQTSRAAETLEIRILRQGKGQFVPHFIVA